MAHADAPTTTQQTETTPADDVRRFLLENHTGVLGTVHADERQAGYPFLSVVPFALDAQGRPLLQLAGIAQHTRNVKADTRASLLVQEPGLEGDPQRGWRITLLGRIAPVEAAEQEEALARFAERVPAAIDYLKQHDFGLYRLTTERVRYIGGFGKIYWVNGDDTLRDGGGAGVKEAAGHAVEHMNSDHRQSMIEMCEGLYGFKPEAAQMTALDRAGFLVRTTGPERLLHFSFGKEIDGAGIRTEVISVLKRAKAAGGAARP